MTHPTLASSLRIALALTCSVMASGQARSPSPAPGDSTGTNSVSLGEHSKLTAKPAERERIRTFYQDVLGCRLTVRSSTLDSFQLGSAFNIGIVYDPAAPSATDIYKGIWLELQTDHPDELKDKILAFGIQGLDYFDKKHFYFQAPGGQVFRIVRTGEVL